MGASAGACTGVASAGVAADGPKPDGPAPEGAHTGFLRLWEGRGYAVEPFLRVGKAVPSARAYDGVDLPLQA